MRTFQLFSNVQSHEKSAKSNFMDIVKSNIVKNIDKEGNTFLHSAIIRDKLTAVGTAQQIECYSSTYIKSLWHMFQTMILLRNIKRKVQWTVISCDLIL